MPKCLHFETEVHEGGKAEDVCWATRQPSLGWNFDAIVFLKRSSSQILEIF